MKIAIASCAELSASEKDDLPFIEVLETLGVEAEVINWDAKTDWKRFDACLIRTTWDYQDRIEEFTQWTKDVSEKTKLLNSKEIIIWNSHKKYLKELERNGIEIAPSEWLESGKSHSIEKLMAKNQWEKGFLKPLIGANARECLAFDNNKQGLAKAQEHCDRVTAEEDLVLQPYLSSVEEFGETSAIYFDHELSHATRKVPVKGDFRVQDDWGASDYPYELSIEERALATKALDYVAEKFTKLLYARIDFLHDKDGKPYLNEMELIEPSLFFRHGGQHSCELFAKKIVKQIKQ